LFSLLLWRSTDDLRLYFWVQFFPGLAVLLLFLLCPPKYSGTYYWISAAALYALAIVFEFSDGAVYSAGYFLSGHTLKHLVAAAACYAILRYFQTRRLIIWPSARPVGLPVPERLANMDPTGALRLDIIVGRRGGRERSQASRAARHGFARIVSYFSRK